MLQTGLIGTGYWGPNIAKSFELTGKAAMRWFCDVDTTRLNKIIEKYPHANSTTEVDRMLEDPALDAVAISTPAVTHYELTRKALEAGKHVLVEKPITLTSKDALQLIAFAQDKHKILMVGHVFEYNFTVRALKNLIDSGELGEIHYLNFERTNLGPVRTDVNALWDLASHDVSIMCYILDGSPMNVTARGQAFLNSDLEDAVFATFTFANGVIAHVNASWLNPRKVREITAVGSKKMAIWNDLDQQNPIQIYDKRVEWPSEIPDTFHGYKTAVVNGGVYIPHIQHNQPLLAECEHFFKCIEQECQPQTNGYSGLRVVLALEAATASMKNQSKIATVKMRDMEAHLESLIQQHPMGDKEILQQFVENVHEHLSVDPTPSMEPSSKGASAGGK
ncbi:Gfo/Idh/MocA family oxidoreductase [candidate division KSB1 bacterium]|nr:Gfo/Idh/MocA family oxidoreductase [candidate division KSB1 bacterium]NIR72959.1 Gfo/Idh/MocA family oxidoreductase [candidate division KSB1 bacterium]NIS25176.1 Gfo/Idh/MocA family oxidoreductase [candidate division KSB1 bacterium]NIT72079.1 Gfo/Idh/MocA family oxidoreductase [candidate division KSB1 bacterium]NIU25879.1 Gfo/Idh/MocA family oxidoreductase [candidate division KSB1 bacterium]